MVLYVPTILDLISDATPVGPDGLVYIVAGYHFMNDGGGGTFLAHEDPLPVDWYFDGGLIFEGNNTDVPPRWYQRMVDTPFINVKWFGAWGRGREQEDDCDAIRRAIIACKNYQDGFGVNICTSGNTFLQANTSVKDATRTRLYFPAGTYIIAAPIGVYTFPGKKNVDFPISPYQLECFEMWGEESIIARAQNFKGPNIAFSLDPIIRAKIYRMIFIGFDVALQLVGNNEAEVIVENVKFNNSGNGAVIDCPFANVSFINTHWTACTHGVVQYSGNVSAVEGWVNNKAWTEDNEGFFHFMGRFFEY